MKLRYKSVAYLVGPGYEDLEFWVPLMRLKEEGAKVTIVGLKAGEEYKGKNCLPVTAEAGIDEIQAKDFDGAVIPGGWAPDKLRRNPAVLALVKEIYESGKIVAMICHGGQVGISAGIVKGHEATGTTAIKDDLINAGAIWKDAPAFRDGNLVWGRVVADIPDFCRELVAALEESGPTFD
jgi:protease I